MKKIIIIILALFTSCTINEKKAPRLFEVFSKIQPEERELSSSLGLSIEEERFYTTKKVLQVALLAPFYGKQAAYGRNVANGMKIMLKDRPEIEEKIPVQLLPIDCGTTITDMESAIEKLDQYKNIAAIIVLAGADQTKILYASLKERNVPILSLNYDISLKNMQNLYMIGERLDDAAKQLVEYWQSVECVDGFSNHCYAYALLPDTKIGNVISSQCGKKNIEVFRYGNQDAHLALQDIGRGIREIEKSITEADLCSNKNSSAKIGVLLRASGWQFKKIYHQIISSPKLSGCEIYFLNLAGLDLNEIQNVRNLFAIDTQKMQYKKFVVDKLNNSQSFPKLVAISYDALLIVLNSLQYNSILQKWEWLNSDILPVIIQGAIGALTIGRDGSVERKIVVKNYN